MRRRLQIALMAIPVIATILSITMPQVRAQAVPGRTAPITASTDDDGHTVYVNDSVPVVRKKPSPAFVSSGLVYWSPTAHRWKPVASANIRAARSAAQEVSRSQQISGATRTTPFTQQEVDAAIDQAAARHNVDPNLVRALIKVESNFNPNAVSRKGAMGLMQLMPQTARQLNVTNPFDPQQNVDAGVRHLKQLMESYGGDVRLSLAAYNAGPGAVARSAGVPRIAETRNYVKRITQLYYNRNDQEPAYQILSNPVHDPVRVQRDANGVLYISNTE
ncbi:MAG TPA: lytic transglycosylase domain-containing protein [Terriglobales bacterium]|nr:lytic transglycosylase domain-containing protein [Terriglobales bacterium]